MHMANGLRPVFLFFALLVAHGAPPTLRHQFRLKPLDRHKGNSHQMLAPWEQFYWKAFHDVDTTIIIAAPSKEGLYNCKEMYGQCYWNSKFEAKVNCAEWEACGAIACSHLHNGDELACYARGYDETHGFEKEVGATTYLKKECIDDGDRILEVLGESCEALAKSSSGQSGACMISAHKERIQNLPDLCPKTCDLCGVHRRHTMATTTAATTHAAISTIASTTTAPPLKPTTTAPWSFSAGEEVAAGAEWKAALCTDSMASSNAYLPCFFSCLSLHFSSK